ELLGGWLVRKMTQKPPHPVAVDLIREAFTTQLSRLWYVRTQAPITLPEGEPEPDVVLARGNRRDYLKHHPGPDDVALLVEVAAPSRAGEGGVKRQMYAQAGVPVYWIVTLLERKIGVSTDPWGTDASREYAARREFGAAEVIPVVIDGVEIGRL